MNYLKELNAFYDWLELNTMSVSAIVLWYALMHINNKCGWAPEFTVAISVLETKTGLKRRTIERARNELTQKKRITWKSRKGNQSASYSMICFSGTPSGGQHDPQRQNTGPFDEWEDKNLNRAGKSDAQNEVQNEQSGKIDAQHDVQNQRVGKIDAQSDVQNERVRKIDAQSVAQVDAQCVVQHVAQCDAINKLNKTKQKDNQEEEEQEAPGPHHFFEANGFGTLSPLVAEDINHWLDGGYFDEPEKVVTEALKQAVINNARSWKYVTRILIDWSNRKLKTIQDVQAYQAQWQTGRSNVATFKPRPKGSVSHDPHQGNDRPEDAGPDYSEYDFGF